MNFISPLFFGFMLLVLLLFYLAPLSKRKYLILCFSYLFYAHWSLPFIGVILFTTSVDYFFSKKIASGTKKKQRLLWMMGAITINLIVLAVFKYFYFLMDSGVGFLQLLGYQLFVEKTIHIILPLGISFYTFEAISYMVDVYRGKSPAKNWLDYNFFIMYFPHLISGPIIRFEQLSNQYHSQIKNPSLSRIAKGVELLVLGYIFKVLIANSAAVISDELFNDFVNPGILQSYTGVLAFTVQIYFDFLGYTHIARGASLLLNIELPLNFDHPYLARNIGDFWRRWHISLSNWLKDYLYIPLGGSRLGFSRTCINIMLTMLICGLWHGAGGTYIIWGAYHGGLLVGHRYIKAFQEQLSEEKRTFILNNPVYRTFTILLTFICISLGWVIFRASSTDYAFIVFSRLFNLKGLIIEVKQTMSAGDYDQILWIVLFLVACFSGPWVVRLLEDFYRPLPYGSKVVLVALTVLFCWFASSGEYVPFIYFQF